MKIKPLHPLISCICITNNRPDMLIKAIISFDQQNYPNRELIISYPKSDQSTKELIDQVLKITEIRIIAIVRADDESIGVARNNATAVCNGNYVCMWDDDDLYYYTRIADQHNLMQGKGKYFQSSIVTRILIYDGITHNAYVSFPYHWSGSLLCKKEHLLENPCTDTNHFECTPVINYLASHKLIHEMGNSPSLYTYVYHRGNILNYFHFQYYTRRSELIDQIYSRDIRTELEQKIKINM